MCYRIRKSVDVCDGERKAVEGRGFVRKSVEGCDVEKEGKEGWCKRLRGKL